MSIEALSCNVLLYQNLNDLWLLPFCFMFSFDYVIVHIHWSTIGLLNCMSFSDC